MHTDSQLVNSFSTTNSDLQHVLSSLPHLSLPLFYRLHDAVTHFLYAASTPLRWKQDAAGNKLGEETFSGGEL